MKLSYDWLKEYVKVSAKPEEVARVLTMSGQEVEAIHDAGSDKIMELEITSNRPDCLSVIGLAREVSCLFGKPLVIPEVSPPAKAGEVSPSAESQKTEVRSQKSGGKFECVILDKDLCSYYTARMISNVQVGQANDLIRRRLTALGMRSVNSIADITNYCLMEMGQPLHAFDLDKLEGGKIIVRRAKKGESIVTIDGVIRNLSEDILVIADALRPVAIAGIMGGKDTEVTTSTKNVLLESAYFNGASIRRTARALALASDSSYRFERGVDISMVKKASDRASFLISGEAAGTVSTFYETGKIKEKTCQIVSRIEKIEKLLGVSIKKDKVKNILKHLGMKIVKESPTTLTVKVPSFRGDLKSEIDLVEEIARIYGYGKIPANFSRFIPQIKRKEHSRKVIEKLLEALPKMGLSEIMTYNLISEKASTRFDTLKLGPSLKLINPLSEEMTVLSPHLLDGMLRTISWNINRKNKDLGFFEIGKVYFRSENALKEIPTLCVGLTGLIRRNWKDGKDESTIYDVKGIIEAILEELKITCKFFSSQISGFENYALVLLEKTGEKIGFIAKPSKKILEEYDIEEEVYVAQIWLDEIIKKASLASYYVPVSRFPSSTRDLSILCDKTLASEKITDYIKENGKGMIRKTELLEMYEGEQIPLDKKSLFYSIEYGLNVRTLRDEEVTSLHANIKEALKQKLGVTFR